MEYLVDYAAPDTRDAGEKLIRAEVEKLDDPALKQKLLARLDEIKTTDHRDLYF